jgi:hypothetical protein
LRRLATLGAALVAGTGASAGAAHAAAIGITPAKACYLSGETITLTGSGYTAGYAVQVALDGTSLGQLEADAAGNIAATIELGRMRGAKSHALTAVDTTTNGANAATASFLATTLQVTVKPRNTRAGRRLKLRGYGFMGMANVFMHVRGPGGYKSDNRIARPQGPCGTFGVRRRIVRPGAGTGNYRVQFDAVKRFSRKTRPRVRGTMRVYPRT